MLCFWRPQGHVHQGNWWLVQLGADRRGGSLLRAASAAGAGRCTHVLVTGLRLQKPPLASDMKVKLQVGLSGEGKLSRADWEDTAAIQQFIHVSTFLASIN